jgi:two-component system OmpR family sensor kinase/two-component system sensor histidine kinase BaeS
MGKKQHWHKHGPPWWDRDSWPGQEPERSEPPVKKHGEFPEKHHQHWPPGRDEGHWRNWRHGPPKWWSQGHRGQPEWRHSDKALFARFAVAFGLFALLGCGALLAFVGGLAFLVSHTPGGDPRPIRLVLLLVAAFVLFAIASRLVGRFVSRRLTVPLSETLKAADAIASGDLSARVSLEGSGEFRHFARSFNRMAEALETADRQRRELLADVAHELRTPLTVIQGNLEGLRDGVYDATPEQIGLVLDESHKLGRLVDDLRLLTLAEAGQLPLDLQPLDVPQLLADVRDAFACQAQEARITIRTSVTEPLPSLSADPQRLGQVLGNLVANALRHTSPGGEVKLGAEQLSEDELRLWVADSGEGIPPEDLPRIFDRFWRADPARSHGAGAGMGLGLAIAKSLVEAHGGWIWAESEVGVGTTISSVLPFSA